MFTGKRTFLVLLIAVFAAALWVGRVPLARGQDTSGITVSLTPYEGNPILDVGPQGAWDDETVWCPIVVYQDGMYHMFYSGVRASWTTANVGYATSTDGFTWEKHAEDPVFEPDGGGFDARGVYVGAAFIEGENWVIDHGGQEYIGTGSGIGRATAPGATGPWTRSETPVLALGSQGEWDSSGIFPTSVIPTGDGYVMYYLGSPMGDRASDKLGLATSPDGIAWTKYNDPATGAPYAESDPVLEIGYEDWHMTALDQAAVLKTVNGWEMFYTEKGDPQFDLLAKFRIGYATSDDGIRWIKTSGFPALQAEDDPASRSMEHLIAGSAVVNDSTYFLYYDYFWNDGGIGVATGTITRE